MANLPKALAKEMSAKVRTDITADAAITTPIIVRGYGHLCVHDGNPKGCTTKGSTQE